MAYSAVLEKLLRHDRILVISGLVAVIISCWAYLLTGAGTMQEMGGMLMPMSPPHWTLGYLVLMLVMWVVMMMAMMLPSAVPMILLYATIARNRQARGEHAAASGIFTLGYIATWSFFSLVAVALQFGLEKTDLLSPMMDTTNNFMAGCILIVAGLYQWTPLKQACLRRCRSPLDFVLAYWREGVSGAFFMGVRHGTYCIGCCWMLMLLLFVGGIMNLVWISGLAIFVLLEKIFPTGQRVGKFAGVLLIGWGAGILTEVIG